MAQVDLEHRIGVSEFHYGGLPFVEAADAVKRSGADFIEVAANTVNIKQPEQVLVDLRNVGIGASSVCFDVWQQPGRDLSHPDREERMKGRDYLRRATDLAATAITPNGIIHRKGLVVVTTPIGEKFDAAEAASRWEYAVDSLQEEALYAQDQGVVFYLEDLNPGENLLVQTIDDEERLIAAVNRPNVLPMHDEFHERVQTEDPETVAQTIRQHPGIKHFHFAGMEWRGRVREDGIPHFTEVFSALRNINYDGVAIAEMAIAPENRETAIPETVRNIKTAARSSRNDH